MNCVNGTKASDARPGKFAPPLVERRVDEHHLALADHPRRDERLAGRRCGPAPARRRARRRPRSTASSFVTLDAAEGVAERRLAERAEERRVRRPTPGPGRTGRCRSAFDAVAGEVERQQPGAAGAEDAVVRRPGSPGRRTPITSPPPPRTNSVEPRDEVGRQPGPRVGSVATGAFSRYTTSTCPRAIAGPTSVGRHDLRADVVLLGRGSRAPG